MVKLSRRGSVDLGSIPIGCWNSLPFLSHFAWPCARQCTDMLAFYMLSIIFFLGCSQWWSHADRVLTLNMNIQLPLFWSTWSRALGQDSATCVGLADGLDYSCCWALELKLQKCPASVFPWIVENTWKTMAYSEGFSTLIHWTGTPSNILLTASNILHTPPNILCTPPGLHKEQGFNSSIHHARGQGQCQLGVHSITGKIYVEYWRGYIEY